MIVRGCEDAIERLSMEENGKMEKIECEAILSASSDGCESEIDEDNIHHTTCCCDGDK